MWHSRKSSLITRGTHIDTPDLPDELWWKIIEFLPTEEVQRLYSVNRPFLEAAFQQRYRFVDLDGLPIDKRRFRDLERRLKDETLAKYVRVIHLRPTIFGAFLHHDIRGRRKWKRIFSNVLQKMNPMQPRPVFTGNLISNVLGNMRRGPSYTDRPGAKTQFDGKILYNLASLTQLEVVCDYFEFWYSTGYTPLLGFLSAGWDSFGPNLQILRLKMPLVVVYGILSSNPIALKLPDLRELVLEVSMTCPPFVNYVPEGDVTQLTTLLPLINNHSNTLRALTLHSLYSNDYLDLPLKHLSYMPSLDSFSISIDEKTDCSALHDFLSLHQHQLRNLAIRLEQGFSDLTTPSSHWFQPPCFHVELPGLRNLSLDGCVYPLHPAAAVDYVLRYNAELTTLRLTAGTFSFAEVNDLINGFVVRSKLRKLHIFTIYLSPDLLRFLSTTLPNLQDLTIMFHSILPQEGSEISLNAEATADAFCEEMKNLYVPEWAVHSLFTSPLGYAKNLKCRTALAAAFPNILTFNGLEREDYLMPGSVPGFPYYSAS
ncbi:uncharacterized protein LACBIDRAFT_310018 [Laccaria bicolor S238N-H82]|uniref:Predicted protein n=1 Tax=Laccaria bicolor (strain S238N-H82 / ATCC MYA-4686) TaxID=486041 RepID=B0DTG7_LACBS|nr:uncharacterized protein LACBIDRAFT_310018 [Laccaria bicolor S238N-H82]EDR02109.1 predicted protein [Laccaria bicolor S238N-H82]|eukprot:XP_001887266.1 predicted protein [Laccaria bicolor S238N-H82]